MEIFIKPSLTVNVSLLNVFVGFAPFSFSSPRKDNFPVFYWIKQFKSNRLIIAQGTE